jgi:leucyl aminopeptidase (aminopeptidase T)
VRVSFSKGVVSSIDGGKDAAALRALLESYDDPSVYRAVEMGIGLNPKAVLERSYLESEAEHGSMHLGIGDGTTFGISHRSPAHVDLVVRRPILELDGRTILKDGVLYLD